MPKTTTATTATKTKTKSTTKSAPTLIDNAIDEHKKRPSKPAPIPPSFSTFPRLSRAKSFLRAADRAIELRKLVAVGEVAKEMLKQFAEDELEPELLAGGVPENITIDYFGVRVRIADEGSGARIDPARLIRAGVSKKVIDAATVPNKRKHYIDITLPLDATNEALRNVGLPEKEAKRPKIAGEE